MTIGPIYLDKIEIEYIAAILENDIDNFECFIEQVLSQPSCTEELCLSVTNELKWRQDLIEKLRYFYRHLEIKEKE